MAIFGTPVQIKAYCYDQCSFSGYAYFVDYTIKPFIMKKIFTLIAACIPFVSLYAQDAKPVDNEKFDTVFMKNTDVKVGTITDVNDDAVRFVHKGETLNYTLKKADIVKIVFASGRVENVSEPASNNSDKNT